MKKHGYIKMIEGSGNPSSVFNKDGSRATAFNRDGTDTDAVVSGTNIRPGGHKDDGTPDHIFDENREFDGGQT